MFKWLLNSARAFFEPVQNDLERLVSWTNRSFAVDWTTVRVRLEGDKVFFDYAKNTLTLVGWWTALILIWKAYPDTLLTLVPFGLFGVFLILRFLVTTFVATKLIGDQLQKSRSRMGRFLSFVAHNAFGFVVLSVFYMLVQAIGSP